MGIRMKKKLFSSFVSFVCNNLGIFSSVRERESEEKKKEVKGVSLRAVPKVRHFSLEKMSKKREKDRKKITRKRVVLVYEKVHG